MTPLTTHFFLEEFACKDGTPYPIDRIDDEDPARRTWLATRLLPLAETLEVVRGVLGKAIRVDSGYRTLDYDGRLFTSSGFRGGKAAPDKSQHPKGRAADIKCASLSAKELRDLIGFLYQTGRLPHLGGLGLYPSFVHVDVRPRGASDHLAQWGGSRLTNIP